MILSDRNSEGSSAHLKSVCSPTEKLSSTTTQKANECSEQKVRGQSIIAQAKSEEYLLR